MRILAQQIGKPSVWRQMKEYVVDGQETKIDTEGIAVAAEHEQLGPPQQDEQEEEEEYASTVKRASEALNEDETSPSAPLEESGGSIAVDVEQETKGDDQQDSTGTEDVKPTPDERELALRSAERKDKAEQDALDTQNLAASQARAKLVHARTGRAPDKVAEEMKKKDIAYAEKQEKREQAVGISQKAKLIPWSVEQARGTSQIVSFTAKFVDKLSEITDDMNLSPALAVKTRSLGVSGRGSYVNTDRFHESDVRFYISVKVVNQSINFKDALEFFPVRSVPIDDREKFNATFGDSFISGFLEGGEFNALVTIKILNDAKKKDIEAEARVAFGGGGSSEFELNGEGNIKLARANISLNTQTHIHVSWCGGGSLKAYNEEWTLDSLLKAATRFPALVAQFPQRTYAILTRYNALRSFVMLKPVKLSPLRYENAALYTNQLLDIFMAYKSLHKNISADILDVQTGIKRFKQPLPDAPPKRLSSTLFEAKLGYYPATLEGLDSARHEVRRQMNAIAHEVDEITKRPELATAPSAGKGIVGCASFESLLPEIELKIGRSSVKPLTGQRINQPVDDDPDKAAEAKDAEEYGLFDATRTKLALSADETSKLAQLERDYTWMALSTKVTAPVGNPSRGEMFCTLDMAHPAPVIAEVAVGRRSRSTGHTLGMLSFAYTNGVQYSFGGTVEEYTGEDALAKGHSMVTLSGLGLAERIVSATIEVDAPFQERDLSIVGLTLRTNKGRTLDAKSDMPPSKIAQTYRFDKPMINGCVTGFWGRADTDPGRWGLERLGLVWSEVQSVSARWPSGGRLLAWRFSRINGHGDCRRPDCSKRKTTFRAKLEDLA